MHLWLQLSYRAAGFTCVGSYIILQEKMSECQWRIGEINSEGPSNDMYTYVDNGFCNSIPHVLNYIRMSRKNSH